MDLAAIGTVHTDDAAIDPGDVRIIVGFATRRSGRGPITLRWKSKTVVVDQGILDWLTTTNKGWVHLRGQAWSAGAGDRLPFRMDMFSASAVEDPGPDRLVLRLYAAGADPDTSSPIHKYNGWLARGSVRLGIGR